MDSSDWHSGRSCIRQVVDLEEGEDFWLLESQKTFLTTESCIKSKRGHCDACGYKGHARALCPMAVMCASLLITP